MNNQVQHRVTSVNVVTNNPPVNNPHQADQPRRMSRKIESNSKSKSPVIIRGESRDRNTFGIDEAPQNQQDHGKTPNRTTVVKRQGPIMLNDTTLNRTSSPIGTITDTNVISRRIILGGGVPQPQDSNRDKSPQTIQHFNSGHKKVETRQYVAQQVTSHDTSKERNSTIISRITQMDQKSPNQQNYLYESSPIARRVTNHGKGTIYFDNNNRNLASIMSTERENELEVSSGSIDINSIERSNSKSPVVPRLNYNDITRDRYHDTSTTATQTNKTNTNQIRYTSKETVGNNHIYITNNTSTKPYGDTSRYQTGFTTQHPEVSKNDNLVMKSPLKSPIQSKHKIQAPELLNSSPPRTYYNTPTNYTNYQPVHQTSNILNNRVISSPIRSTNYQPQVLQSNNYIRSTGYDNHYVQPSPTRVIAGGSYLDNSPGRRIASPSPIRTYGGYGQPTYQHAPVAMTNYSPIRTTYQAPAYQAPIYSAPAYQHRPAPVAIRTPSIIPAYIPEQPIIHAPPVENTITPSFRPNPPRPIYSPIYTDPKQHGTSANRGPVPPHKNDFYQPPSSYKVPTRIEVMGGKKKVERIRAKVVESLEADLSNPPRFFNNNLVGTLANRTALDLGETNANKLSMNDEGTLIYATGVAGTHVVGINGPILSKEDFRPDRPGSMVECIRANDLIVQDPTTNDLYKLDGILGLERQIEGLPEGGQSIEDFHHYRHSLDYAYLLWRSGQDNMSIVDVETFECVDVIKRFWTFENMSTMPYCATATCNADRILATSQAGPNNFIVHYYQDEGANMSFAKPINAVFPGMYKLTCMETSYDEAVAYIGGRAVLNAAQGGAIVIAVEFNAGLREISSCLLNDLDYGTPHRMQRVSATELLIVACDRHFAILDSRGGALVQIARIANVHDNEITDFVIRGKFMYSKAFNEPLIKSTEFNVAAAPNIVETTTVVRSGIQTPISTFTKSTGNFYGTFNTQKFAFTGLDDVHKLELTNDGQKLFAGGRGLHRFETTGQGLRLIEIDKQRDINFFGMRFLANKDIAIQEPSTNNLVILSEDLEYKRDLKGNQPCIFPQYQWRNPKFSGEDNFFVWFSGTSSISIVNPNNLQVSQLPNILPQGSQKNVAVAMRCVAKDQGNIILISFVMDKTQYFAYYEKGAKPMIFSANNILPTFGRLFAMEISYDRNTWFAGGYNLERNSAVISALGFNSNLNTIKTLELSEHGLEACSVVKRMPHNDDLVIGGLKKMIILNWNGSDFNLIKVIDNVHSNLFSDIALQDNKIYSVCRSDPYIAQTTYR